MRSPVLALLALILALAVGLQVPVAPAGVTTPAVAKPAVSFPFDAGDARGPRTPIITIIMSHHSALVEHPGTRLYVVSSAAHLRVRHPPREVQLSVCLRMRSARQRRHHQRRDPHTRTRV